MKRHNKIYTFFLVFVILFCSLICNVEVVYAAKIHESGDNVVYREAATLGEFDFTFQPVGGNYKYYVDDAAGIPTGGDYYFFKYGDNDKFGAIPRSQVAMYIINRGLGLVMSDSRVADFLAAYVSYTQTDCGHLYNGNTNLGLVLNDISGCVYENYPQNTNMDIPAQEINNYYNFYQYYITTVNPYVPDYINFQTYKSSSALTLVDVNSIYHDAYASAIESMSNGFLNRFNTSSNTFNNTSSYKDYNTYSMYASNSNTFSNFCSAYGLRNAGDTVGYSAIKASNANVVLQVAFYDNSQGTVVSSFPYTKYTYNTNGTFSTSNMTGATSWTLVNGREIACTKDAAKVTVYKDSEIFTSVVNHTYAPSTYTTNTYNDFNTQNTQDITTNTNTVSNSTTSNSTIYNDASEEFTNYYSEQQNYNIDNSVVIEYTQNIINNYYGDEGGGGSGGGGSDDDDDDTIWKALLKAIVDFFKKIGELIAALLTGLLELFNIVLGAFADINNSFTGIKDFLSSIFSWFPTEIVTLMVLGLGLALLASFITWFKR